MKINVCIEATSIEEYLEAIQALAAGYTVVPSITNTVEAPKKQPKRASEVKGKEIPVKTVVKSEDEPKKEIGANKLSETTPTPETEETSAEEKTEASEPKHGFPAVKLIAGKLNKIQDGKAEVKFLLDKFEVKKLSDLKEENYDEFHELASKAIADHDKAPTTDTGSTGEVEKEDTPVESGEKEITLEMVRGVAKQLNDQGFKEEIRKALKKFGESNIGKLKKEDYAEFHKELMKHNG